MGIGDWTVCVRQYWWVSPSAIYAPRVHSIVLITWRSSSLSNYICSTWERPFKYQIHCWRWLECVRCNRRFDCLVRRRCQSWRQWQPNRWVTLFNSLRSQLRLHVHIPTETFRQVPPANHHCLVLQRMLTLHFLGRVIEVRLQPSQVSRSTGNGHRPYRFPSPPLRFPFRNGVHLRLRVIRIIEAFALAAVPI